MGTSSAACRFAAWALLAAVLVALLPVAAAAQEPVKSFDQLNTRLRIGDTVWVTDGQGREVKGRILSLGTDALTLEGGGGMTFGAPDVRLIRLRGPDSLKNGTLIGLGIGGGLASVWCIGAIAADDESMSPGVECAEGFIVFGGLGTLIGVGIDALIPGKKLDVYRAAGSARLSIAPAITPRTKGVTLSFSF